MNEHVDVFPRDAELRRDVFAGALFEEAQRDDGALDAAELGDACAEADDLLGVNEERLGIRIDRRKRRVVDRRVRHATSMQTAEVPRRVAHDRLQRCDVVLGVGLLTREERRKRVLDAFDGLFGIEPFAPGDRHERASFLPDDAAETIEHVGP